MHLIRLMRMGLEVLQYGELKVRRPDADELLDIRSGGLSYEELLQTTEGLQLEMEKALRHCSLPADIDQESVDRLAIDLMMDRA